MCAVLVMRALPVFIYLEKGALTRAESHWRLACRETGPEGKIDDWKFRKKGWLKGARKVKTEIQR